MSDPVKEYYNNGNLKTEIWYENDKCHRIDGPAFIRYRENGNLHIEAWYENDKNHRIGAPAYIYYYDNRIGDMWYEAWWENGIPLTDKEVTVIKRKLKLCQIQ